MYDNLPFFLRRVEYKRNEKELVAQTTGRSSGRSHAATWLICDEADYIQGIDEIYKAAMFTIAATKGKIIVLSTPNMHGSWFQRMVKGARDKQNGFTLIEGYWHTIPWRTQAWYDEQCQLLNHDKKSIATELDMKWILPYETYFEDTKLMAIKGLLPTDIICGTVNQYVPPNDENTYIISVDCQEEGADSNAVVVFDLFGREIAAELVTRMNVYETTLALSNLYNSARIMIERNRGFYLIKKFEENEQTHLLLPNIRWVAKTDKYEFDLDQDGKPNKLGFVTLKNTRSKLLMHLSEFVHKSKSLPKPLIEEAQTFVIKRGKPQGLEHDDLIMATGIALLTAAVIEETKELAKSDRKLMALINSYWGKTLENSQKVTQKKVADNINTQINSMIRTTHAVLGTAQYDHLAQIEQLKRMNIPITGKLSKALSFLH
jgi:hypothetical protein